MSKYLPVIGAAMTVLDLPKHRDWVLEKQRDLELQDFVFASILAGDWTPFADIARKMLDGYTGRLGLHGPFSGFEIDSKDPDVRTVVIRRLEQALDVCQALGAVQLVLHSPYKTWDHNNLDLKPNARSQRIEAVHRCLSQAVKRAEDQGVMLVIENIQDVDPDERQRLADSFQSDAVQVSVDTGHAYYAHCETGAPPVDRFIQRAGARLGHVHLQDADGYADRHWSLGEGSICWHSVFSALAQTHANPHLILEINNNDQFPQSMQFLIERGLAQ